MDRFKGYVLRTGAFLALLLSSSGCDEDEKSWVLGSWRTPDQKMSLTTVPFVFVQFDFHNSGTVTIREFGKSFSLDTHPFELSRNKFPFTGEEESVKIEEKTYELFQIDETNVRIEGNKSYSKLKRCEEQTGTRIVVSSLCVD